MRSQRHNMEVFRWTNSLIGKVFAYWRSILQGFRRWKYWTRCSHCLRRLARIFTWYISGLLISPHQHVTMPPEALPDYPHHRPSNLSTSKMSRYQRRLARLSMLLCHRTFSSYQAISWDLEAITLKNYQKLISKDLQVDLAGMRGNTSAGLP